MKNNDSGIKFENQLQVKLSKAIYGLGWGGITLEDFNVLSSKINSLNELINLEFRFVDESKNKKLIKFQNKFSEVYFDNQRVNQLKDYVDLSYLILLKYPELKHSFFTEEILVQINSVDYIDELLHIKELKELSQFENFIIRISDRSKVSFQETISKKFTKRNRRF
jgi:DNA ligase (NAD+)